MNQDQTIPSAISEIHRQLGFDWIPDEWNRKYADPGRINEFINMYLEYRSNPNEWFRYLLIHLIFETIDRAVDENSADEAFLAKIQRFLFSIRDEQRVNLQSQLEYWASENDEKARLLCPIFRALLTEQ